MIKIFQYCEKHGTYKLFDLIVLGKSGKLGCVSCFCQEQGRPEPPAPPPFPPMPLRKAAPSEGSNEEYARVTALNLRRWKKSGMPFRWVKKHKGQWNHNDWEELISCLFTSKYWPMELNEIGIALEAQKRTYREMFAQ